MTGGAAMLTRTLIGGVDTGWTFYTPYSITYANTNVMAAAFGVFITGFSSILDRLNFIVTVHKHAGSGSDLVPPAALCLGALRDQPDQILGTPVVAITLVLVALERAFGSASSIRRAGGDPILFQHLFWFYSHPAVYIMILPAMGVISRS